MPELPPVVANLAADVEDFIEGWRKAADAAAEAGDMIRLAIDEASGRLDLDDEGYKSKWAENAAAARAAAEEIKAAREAASGDISIHGNADQQLRALTVSAREAAANLASAGRAARQAGDDIEQGAAAGERGASRLGSTVEEAANRISTGSRRAGSDARRMGQDVEQGAEEAGTAAERMGERVGSGVGKAVTSMGQIRPIWQAVIALAPVVAAGVMAAGEALIGFGGAAATAALGAKGLEGAARQANTGIALLRAQISQEFRQDLSQAFLAAGQAVRQLTTEFRDVASAISDVIKDVLELARSADGISRIKDILNGVRDMLEALRPGVIAVADAFLTFGQTAAAHLGELGQAISHIGIVWDQTLQKLKQTGQLDAAFKAAAEVVSAFGDVLGGVLTVLVQIAAEAGPNVAQILHSIGQALKDAGPGIAGFVKGFTDFLVVCTPLIEAIGKIIGLMGESGLARAAGVAAGALSMLVQVGPTVLALMMILTGLADIAGKIMNNWGPVGGFFDTLFKHIKSSADQNIKPLPDQMAQSLDQGKPKLENSGQALMDALFSGVQSHKSRTIVAFGDTAEEAHQKLIEEGNRKMPDAGKSLMELLAQGVDSGKQEPVDKTKEVPGAAADATKQDAAQKMPEVGKAMMEGITKGISEGASGLLNAMIQAASSAIQAVKQFLGIMSPSQVFADEVGAMIPAGWAGGIIAHAGQVTDAVRTVGQQALTAGSSSLAGMGLGGVGGIPGAPGAGQAFTIHVAPGGDQAVATMIAQLARTGKLQITANAVVGR